eukprot:PhM_4_TR11296/c4_g2_i2/m.93313
MDDSNEHEHRFQTSEELRVVCKGGPGATVFLRLLIGTADIFGSPLQLNTTYEFPAGSRFSVTCSKSSSSGGDQPQEQTADARNNNNNNNNVRIVHISDTHNRAAELLDKILPMGDVLVHTGDACNDGQPEEFRAFVEWFVAQPHPHKIFLSGNHDYGLQDMSVEEAQKFLFGDVSRGCHYLQDSGVEVMGIKFWGSPWTMIKPEWATDMPSALLAQLLQNEHTFTGAPSHEQMLMFCSRITHLLGSWTSTTTTHQLSTGDVRAC